MEITKSALSHYSGRALFYVYFCTYENKTGKEHPQRCGCPFEEE